MTITPPELCTTKDLTRHLSAFLSQTQETHTRYTTPLSLDFFALSLATELYEINIAPSPAQAHEELGDYLYCLTSCMLLMGFTPNSIPVPPSTMLFRNIPLYNTTMQLLQFIQKPTRPNYDLHVPFLIHEALNTLLTYPNPTTFALIQQSFTNTNNKVRSRLLTQQSIKDSSK